MVAQTPVFDEWASLAERERSEFLKICDMDVFGNWARNKYPQEMAQDELHYGVELRYAGDPSGISEQFFARCDAILQRMINEDRFPVPRGKSAAGVRATFAVTKVFNSCFLGQQFEGELLREAAIGFSQAAQGGLWEDIDEFNYVRAIRLALISGNVELAGELSATKKTFADHGTQFELLRDLCRAVAADGMGADLRKRFDDLFQPICRPSFKASCYDQVASTRFELGAIRAMYLGESEQPFTCQGAVEAVAGRATKGDRSEWH
jgi:hypothetical protein